MSGRALPVLSLRMETYDQALACVHCGLCLPSCPTYTTTWHEADSPRGRIELIKGLADGEVEPNEAVRAHLDLCLDCRACESACPSGVVYHWLIEEAREQLEVGTFEPVVREKAKGGERGEPAAVKVTWREGESGDERVLREAEGSGRRSGLAAPRHRADERLLRWFFLNVMTVPGRLRWALLPARLMQRTGLLGLAGKMGVFRRLPGGWGKLAELLPDGGKVWPGEVPTLTAAKGERKLKVGLVSTCVGSVIFEGVNRKAAELLAELGAEVACPPAGAGGQGCCGAIHVHNGASEGGKDLARRNIDAMEAAGVDRIVATVAGCGAQLREYGRLLAGDAAYAGRAERFVEKVRDVTEVVAELGLPPRERLHPVEAVATYHEACHLVHGQRVRRAPRELLAQVPGLEMRALRESDVCCGAAGTYNLTQPAMATALGERKLSNVDATGAGVCVSGNAGCTLHLSAVSKHRGRPVRLVHPVELLHAAVFGGGLEAGEGGRGQK